MINRIGWQRGVVRDLNVLSIPNKVAKRIGGGGGGGGDGDGFTISNT